MKVIFRLFLSNFFSSSFSDGKFVTSHLYLFIKDLFLLFFQHIFLFLHNLSILKAIIVFSIDRIYFCFFCSLSNQENLYNHDSDLFNNIYNTINEQNQRQTHYLSLIPNYFDIYFWVNQRKFNFISFISNYDFHANAFWMHYMLFTVIYWKNKVICYRWLNFPYARFFEIIYDVF